MNDKKPLVYYGELKIPDGKYTAKDGKEKTRYVTVGRLYHSPHLSRVTIYLNPTATTEGKWVNAYPHEEYQKPEEAKPDVIAEVTDDPINLEDIPF